MEASLGPGFLGLSKHAVRRLFGALFSYHSMAVGAGRSSDKRECGGWRMATLSSGDMVD